MAALVDDGIARERIGSVAIHVPHLIDYEVAGALRNRVLRGTMTAVDGERALFQWTRLGIERYPAGGLMDRIWELRDNLTPYDAAYAALAEALQYPLLTADARLANAPGIRCEIQVVPG